MYFANTRSIVNKIKEINTVIIENNIDIIIINESWLKNYIPNNYILRNFNIFRRDGDSRGGGVFIAIKDNYKCTQRFIESDFEDIFVGISMKNMRMIVSTLYRPPNYNINFNEYLKSRFDILENTRYDMICFCGDLNINFTENNLMINSEAKALKQLFLFYGLEQINSEPTYPALNSKSILDLFFTSNKGFIKDFKVMPNISENCDHKSLMCDILIGKNRENNKMIDKLDINSDNLNKLNENFFDINWFELTENENNINNVFSIIVGKYNEIFNEIIPKRKILIKPKLKYNYYIQRLIRNRRKLSKYKLNDKYFVDKYEFLTYRIGVEIENYENNKMQNIINESKNFSKLYKNIKYISKYQNSVSFIDSLGNTVINDNIIVNNFKNIFQSKFTSTNQLRELELSVNYANKLEYIDISMNDILVSLKQFDFNKSEGLTFIKNIVLKNCLNGISKLLYCLYNKILEFRDIPNVLKKSIVSSILKGNKNKHLFNSYRGISVQPNIYRIFETILLNNLSPFLAYNHIIPECRYGYRAKTGISKLHIDSQKIIHEALNENNLGIDIIYLDLSDAFDTISHQRLLEKLNKYNICGLFYDILCNTFKDRVQVVKFNNCLSNEINVTSGVAQGGVLSPTLFNIYMSDIILGLNSIIFKFADDMILMRKIKDNNDCNILQTDLDKILKFCKDNSLKLNVDKCESMRISMKNSEQFVYSLDNNSIKYVTNHKYVGVLYDTKLSFNYHLDMICEKSVKKFYTLKNICDRVDCKTFLKLY